MITWFFEAKVMSLSENVKCDNNKNSSQVFLSPAVQTFSLKSFNAFEIVIVMTG